MGHCLAAFAPVPVLVCYAVGLERTHHGHLDMHHPWMHTLAAVVDQAEVEEGRSLLARSVDMWADQRLLAAIIHCTGFLVAARSTADGLVVILGHRCPGCMMARVSGLGSCHAEADGMSRSVLFEGRTVGLVVIAFHIDWYEPPGRIDRSQQTGYT